MKDFWEERYRQKEYAYGKKPNSFFKEVLEGKESGTILLPAEGEGRNGVYAALKGWKVEAFDYSLEAQKKALALAREHGVSISYQIAGYSSFKPKKAPYSMIAFVYTHTDPETREAFINRCIDWLAPEGRVVMEVYSKNQLGKDTGGPKTIEMLSDLNELKESFQGLEIEYLEELDIEINEGLYHNGEGSVIRLIAKKAN